MFTRKKTVQESKQMISVIDVKKMIKERKRLVI